MKDPDAIIRLTRTLRSEDASRIEDALNLLAGNTSGRFFLRYLIALTGYGQRVPPADPYEVAYTTGQHSVGLAFIEMLDEAHPFLYPELLTEGRKEAHAVENKYNQLKEDEYNV